MALLSDSVWMLCVFEALPDVNDAAGRQQLFGRRESIKRDMTFHCLESIPAADGDIVIFFR